MRPQNLVCKKFHFIPESTFNYIKLVFSSQSDIFCIYTTNLEATSFLPKQYWSYNGYVWENSIPSIVKGSNLLFGIHRILKRYKLITLMTISRRSRNKTRIYDRYLIFSSYNVNSFVMFHGLTNQIFWICNGKN